jgi:hypothetical protein
MACEREARVLLVKMHVGEMHTDATLVHRLLVAQFPQWADHPIAPVPSAGTDNAIYRLGSDMAVRLPRILNPDEAASSVDTRTERLSQGALAELLAGGGFYHGPYTSQFRYNVALASDEGREPAEFKEMRPTGLPGADD